MFLECSWRRRSACWLYRGHQVSLLLVLSAALSISCRRQPQAEPINAPSPQAAVRKNNLETQPRVVVGKPYPARGIITLINFKEGWVEINHEDIEGLMPAMEMEWSVKDRSLLQNVNVGDKVEFVVVETGKGEIITELKAIK